LYRVKPGLPAPFNQVDDIAACAAMDWFGHLADLPTRKDVVCYKAAEGLAAVLAWPQS
jgi:hypothetical protein